MSIDYDAIVGGVGEIIDNCSIMHGGNEIVVGGAAKGECRDKILHLKHAPNDTKKLLAIINMSRPVVYGNVEYDDGASSKLKAGPMMSKPDDALITSLNNRLQSPASDVVNALIYEYRLAEPVYWALTDLIQLLLRRIKNKRPNMRLIKINGNIGEILDRVRNGDAYFKIATDHNDWPDSIPSVVQELLEILRRERIPSGMWNEPKLKTPAWPKICLKNKDAMDQISKKKYKTVREYVEAIVLREHILVGHMDCVEMYYIDTAHDIKNYTSELASFIKTNRRTKVASASLVVKNKTMQSFVVTRSSRLTKK